jgi:hypothetical protein
VNKSKWVFTFSVAFWYSTILSVIPFTYFEPFYVTISFWIPLFLVSSCTVMIGAFISLEKKK